MMRNKILIVGASAEEKEQFEQTLQEVVESGGELIFADIKEEGLKILKKERPQVVFLNSSFFKENTADWELEGVQICVMRAKNETHPKDENCLFRPLKAHQILEKCEGNLHREPAAQIPPM